jgi:hypothetical protein
MLVRVLVACTLASLSFAVGAQSPYAGQTSRAIKSLSSGDVADYLAGNGMGFAKAAELNGYPGPAHVLALAEPLALTGRQRADTEAVFARMQSEARALGERLVVEERALDRAFADGTVTPDALAAATASIAALQGRLRDVHLRAHLEQTGILAPEQVARYATLRGYADAAPGQHPHVH